MAATRAASALEAGAPRFAQCRGRLGIVEDELRPARRRAADQAKRLPDGRALEIGEDAEPGEEGGLAEAEARFRQRIAQALSLEIDPHKARHRGARHARFLELSALPALGLRMVDLEDAKLAGSRRGPIGRSIQARAEHHILPDAPVDGRAEAILRDAASALR